MELCGVCVEAGHVRCWDVKPDRGCPCCLDTWFGELCEPRKEVE
jgi:hypothetical protein